MQSVIRFQFRKSCLNSTANQITSIPSVLLKHWSRLFIDWSEPLSLFPIYRARTVYKDWSFFFLPPALELTARGQGGAICWIWEQVYEIRIVDCTFNSFVSVWKQRYLLAFHSKWLSRIQLPGRKVVCNGLGLTYVKEWWVPVCRGSLPEVNQSFPKFSEVFHKWHLIFCNNNLK